MQIKILITALLLNLQKPEQQGFQSYFGTLEHNKISKPEDLDKYTEHELMEIGGNLSIDYNDNCDDSFADNLLWEQFVKPIDSTVAEFYKHFKF